MNENVVKKELMETPLFNTRGNDFDFDICPIELFDLPVNQRPTGLVTTFSPRDPKIHELQKLQYQRFWRAEDYNIDRTKEGFEQLSNTSKKIFEYILSFLSFLDSIQLDNLANIQMIYRLPEYKLWGIRHQMFEAEHTQAYEKILLGLFENSIDEIKRIFYLSINYPELKKRNELIAREYQRLRDLLYDVGLKNINSVKYAETVWRTFITTYAMESITFYMGFLIIHLYQYKYGILPSTNKMISEIKADELFHVKVMSYIINKIKPYIERYIDEQILDEIAREIIDSFVNADIQFYQSVIQNNEFNISDKQVEMYIKNLANRRYKLLIGDKNGSIELYSGYNTNPFESIDKLYGYVESHINENKKESFFETKSAAYQNKPIDDNVFNDFEL